LAGLSYGARLLTTLAPAASYSQPVVRPPISAGHSSLMNFILQFCHPYSGYSDLKELIPQTASAMGCKTTNAAILFRACDYMTQLTSEVEANEKDIQQLSAQVSSRINIDISQFALTPSTNEIFRYKLASFQLQILLDDCFSSFIEQVDFSSYATITRTLLTWVEQIASHNDQFKVRSVGSDFNEGVVLVSTLTLWIAVVELLLS
uniref:BHLH domain-containing protein n=1 Tax=Heligmosomoides polygyrus TaxID=6339 RepID=A0A183FQD4_HELPZ